MARVTLTRQRLERAIRLSKSTEQAARMLGTSSSGLIRAARWEGIEFPWKPFARSQVQRGD